MAIDNELPLHIRLSQTADGKVSIVLPDGMTAVAIDTSVALEFATSIVQLATMIEITTRRAMERNPAHDN